MRKALLGVAMLALACGQATAQESWQPPRTPDGKPDLQGTWTNASLTTLERPAQFKTQTIPADRAQQMEQARARMMQASNAPHQSQRRRADRWQCQCRLQLVLDRSGHAVWRGEGRDALVVDRRSAGRPHSLHGGGEEASRGPADEGAQHVGRAGDPAAGRALHRRLRLHGRAADDQRALQQSLPDRADADACRDHGRDDPRRAHHSDRREARRRRASTPGSAIRSAGGRATRWWCRRATSTTTSACGPTWATATMSARTRW